MISKRSSKKKTKEVVSETKEVFAETVISNDEDHVGYMPGLPVTDEN